MRSRTSMPSFSPPWGLWYPRYPYGPSRPCPDPWAISSVGERPPHTREVVGSNPTSPTTPPHLRTPIGAPSRCPALHSKDAGGPRARGTEPAVPVHFRHADGSTVCRNHPAASATLAAPRSSIPMNRRREACFSPSSSVALPIGLAQGAKRTLPPHGPHGPGPEGITERRLWSHRWQVPPRGDPGKSRRSRTSPPRIPPLGTAREEPSSYRISERSMGGEQGG